MEYEAEYAPVLPGCCVVPSGVCGGRSPVTKPLLSW